jgi:hypothetical protein
MMKTMRTSHKMATINRIAPLTSCSQPWAGTPRRIPRPWASLYRTRLVLDASTIGTRWAEEIAIEVR